jgi:hypothetical protein
LKPGGLTRDPADLRLEPGRVEEKTWEGKTWCDPATRLTLQNPVANLLIFIFFNKIILF